jgi:hypothetical protein
MEPDLQRNEYRGSTYTNDVGHYLFDLKNMCLMFSQKQNKTKQKRTYALCISILDTRIDVCIAGERHNIIFTLYISNNTPNVYGVLHPSHKKMSFFLPEKLNIFNFIKKY